MCADPWTRIYLPACADDPAAVYEAIADLEVGRDGDTAAIAARAFLVLGRPADAARLLGLARAAGGDEVEGLLALCRRDVELLRARVERGADPGAAADAACDLAAAQLIDGDFAAAKAAVAEALRRCPDHLEAAHWGRFLAAEEQDPALLLDGRALVPCPSNGWIAPERLGRRKLLALDRPEGSALARLRDAGATGFWFALPEEYAGLPGGHRLVSLELRAEAVVARVDEGRPTGALAESLWACAATDTRSDVAQLLVALATRDPRLAALAVRATEWLLLHDPARAELWYGYRAWHRQQCGDRGALEDALRVSDRDPTAWYLAFATVLARDRARALRLAEGQTDPQLRELAQAALDGEAAARPTVWLSPRVLPRFAAA